MGKVIRFVPDDGDEDKNTEPETRALSEKEFLELVEPLKEGLRRLYPSQVKDIAGVVGLGERRGKEYFVAGLLAWLHFKHPQPILSTFVAVFIDKKLEKISFLEAKNNYWDWKVMVESYKGRFNTETMLEEVQRIKRQILEGKTLF